MFQKYYNKLLFYNQDRFDIKYKIASNKYLYTWYNKYRLVIYLDKIIRKGVRTLLIIDDKIVAIKYKNDENKDYYDIPGGKIEENESSMAASIREFKEETGVDIFNPTLIGHVIVEYPNKIFDFDIYRVTDFDGSPQEFEENNAMWISIVDLLKTEKRFPCIEMLKYLNSEISLRIVSDENHNVIKIEKIL